MSRRPTACPNCKRTFPSRAAMWRHFAAGCCRSKTHIACSECADWLKGLASAVNVALRDTK